MPCNWQEDLISRIDTEHVEDVYGKLPMDFAGGGRPAYILPSVSRRRAARQIKLILKRGLKFNYLLNASCLGNREFTADGQRKLSRIMRWLSELKVEYVTVVSPFLGQWIKDNYPEFKIAVSAFANVNSLAKAKFWEDMGADEITLSPVELNRDFQLLKAIRKNVRCKLQLVANNNCLLYCPLYTYHVNLLAHSSQSGDASGGFIIDYCRLTCNHKRLTGLVNFIKGDWIRPEDISFYGRLGIDKIKLVDRAMTTEALARVMAAYISRTYEGNLLHLFPRREDLIVFRKFNLFHCWKYFFHPLRVNIFKLYRMKQLVKEADIHIDNKALDGFLEEVSRKDCRYIPCDACGYCDEIARKVVRADNASLEKTIAGYAQCVRQFNSGDIFRI